MRAGIVVAFVAVLIGLGPASSAGTFPDLPGMDLVEETMTGDKASSFQAPAESADSNDDADRMPAPEPREAASTAATSQDTAIVKELPGGGNLPIFEELGSQQRQQEPVAALAFLALAIVVLFTRFLYRLNTIR